MNRVLILLLLHAYRCEAEMSTCAVRTDRHQSLECRPRLRKLRFFDVHESQVVERVFIVRNQLQDSFEFSFRMSQISLDRIGSSYREMSSRILGPLTNHRLEFTDSLIGLTASEQRCPRRMW